MTDRGRDFLEEYRKLWVPTDGDTEAALAAVETQLGFALPPLLRAVYRHTSLRSSEQLHLMELDELELQEGVLVFGIEQQGCGFWGVRRSELGLVDPPVVQQDGGDSVWKEEGCSLEGWLRLFAMLNRTCEPPFLHEPGYDGDRLGAPWRRLDFPWNSGGCTLWTNGEAVLHLSGGLGARDLDALKRAARSLGVAEDELDGASLR